MGEPRQLDLEDAIAEAPPPRGSLSPQEKSAIAYIRDYAKRFQGVPPSVRELATYLGMSSPSVAHRLLEGLEARGLIKRIPKLHRGYELVRAAKWNDETKKLEPL